MSDPGTLGRALLLAVLAYLALALTKPGGFTVITVVLIALAALIVFLLGALAVHGLRRLR